MTCSFNGWLMRSAWCIYTNGPTWRHQCGFISRGDWLASPRWRLLWGHMNIDEPLHQNWVIGSMLSSIWQQLVSQIRAQLLVFSPQQPPECTHGRHMCLLVLVWALFRGKQSSCFSTALSKGSLMLLIQLFSRFLVSMVNIQCLGLSSHPNPLPSLHLRFCSTQWHGWLWIYSGH